MAKRKKSKSIFGNVAKYVFTTVLSISAALYIGYHLINSLDDSVKTVTTTMVTQELTYTQDAYLFRTEEMVYSSPGGFSYLADDGERVAVNTPILEVYSDESAVGNAAEISSIDRKLSLLNNSNMQKGVSYNDTSIIDSNISELYYTILQKLQAGKTDFAVRKLDDLLADINRRQIVTGKITDYNEKISELETTKQELQTHSGEILETVKAQKSGYFYSDIDGFESLFNPDDLDYMTTSSFRTLIESEPNVTSSQNEEGKVIAGKLVTDFDWYLALEIDVSDTRYYNEYSTYTIIFPYNSDRRIDCRLEKIVRATDDNGAILIFKTFSNPSGFNYLRRQSVSIVRDSKEGYRVPISAVRIQDGEQGVYVLRGMEIYFKKIIPIMEADGYFVVKVNDGTVEMRDYLALNDEVVTSGKNLYDGKIVS